MLGETGEISSKRTAGIVSLLVMLGLTIYEVTLKGVKLEGELLGALLACVLGPLGITGYEKFVKAKYERNEEENQNQ